MKYGIEETDQFLNDLEEAAIWILLNNIEQSEAFAESKVEELRADLDSLIERLKTFPESGESDQIRGIRRFPIYGGRYSAKWIVNHAGWCCCRQ